jgi:CO/xanthine dehydrogenase Mo-binding subunit
MDEKKYQSKYKRVGQAYDRKDAQEKVTGQAVYAYDMELPGMLHARCLLSPHARARIVSIDTSKANALPGVRAVLTSMSHCNPCTTWTKRSKPKSWCMTTSTN